VFRIRKAKFMDLDQIRQVQSHAFPLEAYRETTWRQFWRTCCDTLWVAVVGAGVRGYLVAEPCAPDLRIHSIAVEAAYRNQGIGTALLQEAMAHCAGSGKLSLIVRRTNIARAFYAHSGFRLEKRVPHYYPDGEGGLLMTLVR
jgi:ribosomal protein S18 acetylase RimI-like enzyme